MVKKFIEQEIEGHHHEDVQTEEQLAADKKRNPKKNRKSWRKVRETANEKAKGKP